MEPATMKIASNAIIAMYLGTFIGTFDIEPDSHRYCERIINEAVKISYYVRQINNIQPD